MRVAIPALVCAVLAAPTVAQGCADLRPRFPFERPVETREYLRCLEGELARLSREQARLAAALEAQARALAALPADYANVEGRVTAVPGRPVGRAVFVVSSRRGAAAASLALDRAVVEALCARPGGCRIALAHQALEFGFANPRVATGVGPCLFAYDPAGGAWFRGEACGSPAARGIDGDGGATGTGGGEVIAAAAGACLLADADSGQKSGADGPVLGRDAGPGFFLIAAPEGEAGTGGTGGTGGAPRFRCELRID